MLKREKPLNKKKKTHNIDNFFVYFQTVDINPPTHRIYPITFTKIKKKKRSKYKNI